MSRVLETRVRRLESKMLRETPREHWLGGAMRGMFPDHESEKRWMIENGGARADDVFHHIEIVWKDFPPDHPKFSEMPNHEND